MKLALIALGLSMDAFAVSICKGLAMQRVTARRALIVGLYFGGFQALMPVLGYFIGSQFADKIGAFDHWVAFALLCGIGLKMVLESLSRKPKPQDCGALTPAAMLPLSIATSIDALAVGLSFALLNVSIAPAAALIGVVTLIVCMLGVKLGSLFGTRYKAKAEFFGGVLLMLLGFNILLQHLNVL